MSDRELTGGNHMDAVNVLWTGGWDSTYRVLELVLIENKIAHPYYLIHPDRMSLAQEIIAMTRIRHRLQVDFPDQARGLLPLEMVYFEDIPPDEEISRYYQRMATLVHIGTQDEGLALFAKDNVKLEPELCIETISGHHPELLLFRDFIRPLLKGEGHECHVEGPFPEPAVQMFKNFRFPIIQLTKNDMRIISEEHGFFDIMKLTWFCLTPRRGLPCGKCRSCSHATSNGLEYTFYQQSIKDVIFDLQNRFLSLLFH